MDKRTKEYKSLKNSYIYHWDRYTNKKNKNSIPFLQGMELAMEAMGHKDLYLKWRKEC